MVVLAEEVGIYLLDDEMRPKWIRISFDALLRRKIMMAPNN